MFTLVLKKIEMHEKVPKLAVAVTISWSFKDEYGEAFLFRLPEDPDPVHLLGHIGIVDIQLEVPQILWMIKAGFSLDVTPLDYRMPQPMV